MSKRLIVHWTFCGETLSCNVVLRHVRNGSDGHTDAVYQATLLVLASRVGMAPLKRDLSCSVWEVDSPLKEDIWDNNEANGDFTWDLGI